MAGLSGVLGGHAHAGAVGHLGDDLRRPRTDLIPIPEVAELSPCHPDDHTLTGVEYGGIYLAGERPVFTGAVRAIAGATS